MKKIYRSILLLILFIFLSTFNPTKFNFLKTKEDSIFKINSIKVINNSLINEKEIKKKLDNLYKSNIFFLKKTEVENPLSGIDFLKTIEVKKKYPNTIIIKVIETIPVAIFYKNKVKYLIDDSSNLVLFKESEKLKNLPNLFGDNAESKLIIFYEELRINKFPMDRIKNYYYFQIGRWDLELFNNRIIKFPDKNIKKSINKSIELLKRNDFKNYNTIDLRVDGKIIVE